MTISITQENAAGAEKVSPPRGVLHLCHGTKPCLVRLRPGDCPGMALGGGERYGISVPLLSMFIRWGYYVTVKLSTPQTVDGTAIHYLTFAHNARNLVSDGDTVTTGTPLAIAGKTGNAEGEHIHCHLQARNVNNSGAYNPVGFSGIRNEKGEYNIKTSGSMQKIELGPVLNSQASAIWNKAKALGVTYAAFYADPDNSRQIIQLGPVSNSMASTLYSYAVNEMKVSYRSWYI